MNLVSNHTDEGVFHWNELIQEDLVIESNNPLNPDRNRMEITLFLEHFPHHWKLLIRSSLNLKQPNSWKGRVKRGNICLYCQDKEDCVCAYLSLLQFFHTILNLNMEVVNRYVCYSHDDNHSVSLSRSNKRVAWQHGSSSGMKKRHSNFWQCIFNLNMEVVNRNVCYSHDDNNSISSLWITNLWYGNTVLHQAWRRVTPTIGSVFLC